MTPPASSKAIHRQRWRRLPARMRVIIFPMILSLLMSGVVSTIATVKAVGIVDGLLTHVLEAWALSYVIAFPSALLVMPLVQKIVSLLVEPL